MPATSERTPATLPRLFEARVDADPDAVAVWAEDGVLAYGELDRAANRLAWTLHNRGIGRGDLVGVCLPRGRGLLPALLGILKIGAAYVPLDPDYPAARVATMREDSAARVVLTDSAALDPALARSLGPATVCLTVHADEIRAAPAVRPVVALTERDLAYVIYTSGSTGTPKGVMTEHGAVVNRLRWMDRAIGLSGGEGVLQKTPTSFDVSVWELFWPVLVGGRCVFARPGGHRDPGYLAALTAAQRVSTVHFVPALLRDFLDQPAEALAGVHGVLRRVVCSGEELPAALADRCAEGLPGVELFNLYGPTEAAVDVTWYPCAEGYDDRVPIGRPISGARLYIVDEEDEPVPVGVAGEVVLGGLPVGRGYWRRPGLTAERFVPDAFVSGGRAYRTGDLARWRADGAVEYLGRIDDQVKIRGVRIELGEVEAVLARHPAISAAAVVPARRDGAAVGLIAHVRSGDLPPAEELREFLRERLPEAFIPSAFVPTRAFPTTPSGKLDRSALPAVGFGSARPDFLAPRDPTERVVADLWAELLGVERVGVHDDFFALGGSSLSLTLLATRLAAASGVTVALRDLLGAQTVEAQARLVNSDAGATPGLPRLTARPRRPIPGPAEPVAGG